MAGENLWEEALKKLPKKERKILYEALADSFAVNGAQIPQLDTIQGRKKLRDLVLSRVNGVEKKGIEDVTEEGAGDSNERETVAVRKRGAAAAGEKRAHFMKEKEDAKPVGEYIQDALKIIDSFKGVAGAATEPCPAAAVAVGAFFAFATMIKNGMDQPKEMKGTIGRLQSILSRAVVNEDTLRYTLKSDGSQGWDDHASMVESSMIDLYAACLEVEAQVLHYFESRARKLRDALKWDGWSKHYENISSMEQEVLVNMKALKKYLKAEKAKRKENGMKTANNKHIDKAHKSLKDMSSHFAHARKTPSGRNLLHMAAIRGSVERINHYIDKGLPIDSRTEGHGWTALHFAAEKHRLAAVETLLKARGVEINARDKKGRTPLHIAARKGYVAIVEELVANKADYKAKDSAAGLTALHAAAARGHTKVVRLLLQQPGIVIYAQKDDGRTALMEAASGNHLPVIGLLLKRTKKAADIIILDKEGDSAASLAEKGGHTDAFKLLNQHEDELLNQRYG